MVFHWIVSGCHSRGYHSVPGERPGLTLLVLMALTRFLLLQRDRLYTTPNNNMSKTQEQCVVVLERECGYSQKTDGRGDEQDENKGHQTQARCSQQPQAARDVGEQGRVCVSIRFSTPYTNNKPSLQQ